VQGRRVRSSVADEVARMLIKEYRIPMPMSVEEYKIAQLYMIQVRLVVVSRRLF